MDTEDEEPTTPRYPGLHDEGQLIEATQQGQPLSRQSPSPAGEQSRRTSFNALLAAINVRSEPRPVEVSWLRDDLLAIDETPPAAVLCLAPGRGVE